MDGALAFGCAVDDRHELAAMTFEP
jgi:hypothetical protein